MKNTQRNLETSSGSVPIWKLITCGAPMLSESSIRIVCLVEMLVGQLNWYSIKENYLFLHTRKSCRVCSRLIVHTIWNQPNKNLLYHYRIIFFAEKEEQNQQDFAAVLLQNSSQIKHYGRIFSLWSPISTSIAFHSYFMKHFSLWYVYFWIACLILSKFSLCEHRYSNDITILIGTRWIEFYGINVNNINLHLSMTGDMLMVVIKTTSQWSLNRNGKQNMILDIFNFSLTNT